MSAADGWQAAVPLGDAVRLSPYAHWWLSQRGGGAQPCFLGLAGRRRGCGAIYRELADCRTADATADATDGAAGAPDDPAPAPRKVLTGLVGDLDMRECLIPVDLPGDVLNRDTCGCPGWAEPEPLPEGSVVVAAIDDGIAFAHERFRHAGGATRFDYLWLQGVARGGGRTDLPLGREFDRAAIDDLLARGDEDTVYRAAGLIDPRRRGAQSAGWRTSHGTAVLDRAGGYAPGDRDGERIVLMGVSLPSAVTHDTSGTFLDLYVILGVQRILERAERLRDTAGRRLPVVVNFSYSLTAGPKDGSGVIDRYLKAARAAWPGGAGEIEFVLPAGNHRLDRVRARVECAAGAPSDPLRWRLPPDDRTASFVEIWLPEAARRPAAPSLACALGPPGAAATPAPAAFDSYVELHRAGVPVARAYHLWHPTGGAKGRERIVVAVPPTVPEAPGAPTAPAGDWTLRLHAEAATVADLYVQRDDTPLGFRQRGRQSYFVDAAYRVFDDSGRAVEEDDGASPVRRVGTVNALGSGGAATLVGASRDGEGRTMYYSGLADAAPPKAGAGTGAAQPAGDVRHLAFADASLVHRGVPVAGTRSGCTVLISGTSMAAPHYTRARSLQLSERCKRRNELFDNTAPGGVTIVTAPEPRRIGGRDAAAARVERL